ncbi:MAG: hypothetical protein LBT50_01025 [Prevotellaceae bacterium]|nr:hypothetical protein [Prevotellaceae bacterium]
MKKLQKPAKNYFEALLNPNLSVIASNLSASGAKKEKDVALGITFTSSRFPSFGGGTRRAGWLSMAGYSFDSKMNQQ